MQGGVHTYIVMVTGRSPEFLKLNFCACQPTDYFVSLLVLYCMARLFAIPKFAMALLSSRTLPCMKLRTPLTRSIGWCLAHSASGKLLVGITENVSRLPILVHYFFGDFNH